MTNLQDNTESAIKPSSEASEPSAETTTQSHTSMPAVDADSVSTSDKIEAETSKPESKIEPVTEPSTAQSENADGSAASDPQIQSSNTEADSATPPAELEPAMAQADSNAANDTDQQTEATISDVECQEKLSSLTDQIGSISHKNTNQLFAVQALAKSLGKDIHSLPTETKSKLIETFTGSMQNLDSKLKKNREHQVALASTSKGLINQVKQYLDEGKTAEALQHWDKLQGNISNIKGKLQSELHTLANEHKSKLAELRDWKTFAATEKKKELIHHIQTLLESRMHASDKAKRIAALHRDWKALGKSHHNESLWKQFKTISDKAYEPCKEYFKQRKQLMASNLVQRKNICEQLESYITELKQQTQASDDPESHSVHISRLNKIEGKAKEEWKRYAPLEQSKVKAIQKRYHDALNQLRKFRKSTLRDNARQKQELVQKAQALIALEDNQQAMRDAQRLQQQWKKIGPGSYREDNQLWHSFRTACDEIFKARDEKRKQEQENIRGAETKLDDTLSALAELCKLDDDGLRAARSNYHDLQQQFSIALDPRIKKERKRYLDTFNDFKRQIDHRLQSMPDKKQQQRKDSLQARSDFCLRQEQELMQCDNETQFQSCRDALDSAAWQALPACGESDLDQAMEQRFARLTATQSLKDWQALMQAQEQEIKTRCIELEIRSESESPKSDQAYRMKIQLDQLKKGFGQQKPNRKENLDQSLAIAMQVLCLGPINSKDRAVFDQRIDNCLKKLR